MQGVDRSASSAATARRCVQHLRGVSPVTRWAMVTSLQGLQVRVAAAMGVRDGTCSAHHLLPVVHEIAIAEMLKCVCAGSPEKESVQSAMEELRCEGFSCC